MALFLWCISDTGACNRNVHCTCSGGKAPIHHGIAKIPSLHEGVAHIPQGVRSPDPQSFCGAAIRSKSHMCPREWLVGGMCRLFRNPQHTHPSLRGGCLIHPLGLGATTKAKYREHRECTDWAAFEQRVDTSSSL